MAKKLVTLVYSSDNAESVAVAVTLLSYYRKDTVQTLDLYGLSEGAITTAVAALDDYALDDDQEYVYSAAPNSSSWTPTHQGALEALLANSETGVSYEWVESETTGTMSMVRDMWDDMSGGSAPSKMIWLLGTPDADLSAPDLVLKAKYAAGLLAKAVILNNSENGIELDTTDAILKAVCDAIDSGIWSPVKNSAFDALMASPDVSPLADYDIITSGSSVYNYLLIETYLPDDSSSEPETGTISITPETQEFAAAGEAKIITVTASSAYEIKSKPNWITGEIAGNKAALTAEANAGAARTGDVIFALTSEPTVTATLIVNQLAGE